MADRVRKTSGASWLVKLAFSVSSGFRERLCLKERSVIREDSHTHTHVHLHPHIHATIYIRLKISVLSYTQTYIHTYYKHVLNDVNVLSKLIMLYWATLIATLYPEPHVTDRLQVASTIPVGYYLPLKGKHSALTS